MHSFNSFTLTRWVSSCVCNVRACVCVYPWLRMGCVNLACLADRGAPFVVCASRCKSPFSAELQRMQAPICNALAGGGDVDKQKEAVAREEKAQHCPRCPDRCPTGVPAGGEGQPRPGPAGRCLYLGQDSIEAALVPRVVPKARVQPALHASPGGRERKGSSRGGPGGKELLSLPQLTSLTWWTRTSSPLGCPPSRHLLKLLVRKRHWEEKSRQRPAQFSKDN